MAKATKKTNSTAEPHFGEIRNTGDPTRFKVIHPSDKAYYNALNKKLLQPIPKPRDPGNMLLQLEKVLGTNGKNAIQSIQKSGKIVFHAGGDTGSVIGPRTQSLVSDKMTNDFTDLSTDRPSFFFHLGDVVYSFGEGRFYYDQFYEPYRDYPAPILAIAGNHDGVVYQGDPAPTLDAFLRNFVSEKPVHTNEASGLIRTAMIQPGVYFALDAPFVRLIGLYSNVLEDPGILTPNNDDQQIKFLVQQLKDAKTSGKCILLAVHHPPFTYGGKGHSGSPDMLKQIDEACNAAGCWPHAVLSGHAHNYQRYTRTIGQHDIPYIVCGNSGHNVRSLNKLGNPVRTPEQVKVNKTDTYSKDIIFENYDDKNYGYLRIICSAATLRIEYHDAEIEQKTESDAVTVDLKTRAITWN